MKTIQEVFSENLRRLRGVRSQAAMSELAGVPFPSYQRAEGGDIPQRPNLIRLARAFGVPETHLFVDMAEFQPRAPLGPLDALAALNTYFTGAPMEKPKPIELAADLDRAQKEIQRLTEKVQELETLLSQGHHMASRIARLSADERTKILDDLALLDAGKAISPIREGLKPPSSSAVKKPR